MSGRGGGARVALIVGSVVAGVLGWFLVTTFGPKQEAQSAPGAVDLFSCPMEGAVSIGQLQPGDAAWLIGVSGSRWGVVRHPDDPDLPAWVPLALIGTQADSGDLPEMGCDVNPSTGTTTPSTTAPPTTVAGASTTIGTTTTSSTTSSTSTTSTTLVTDTVPPVVTVTANREFFYVSPAAACPTEAEVEVSITVVDPTLPLVIRSIVATWTSPSGPQTANLQPVAGNRFKLIIDANGPPSGELPVTITATAADGASNVGTGVVTVALRDPASFGCA